MEHKLYIGKTLKELLENTPKFAIGLYLIIINDKVFHLKDIMNKKEYLEKIILEISDLCPDYTYWISLK